MPNRATVRVGAARLSAVFPIRSSDMMSLFAREPAQPVEAAPEDEHPVQHLPRMLDEDLLVDGTLLQEVLELVVRVTGVIALELRVPREEADVEPLEAAALGVPAPAFDEIVPEARGSPVLDGPRCGRRDRVVLVAVQPDQLVAEVERRGRAEAALAEVGETEPELTRHTREQLEVRRAEAERSAFDRSFGIAELDFRRVVLDIAAGSGRRPDTTFGEADADLVREDLLRLAHLLDGVGVQHLQELRDEELVREDRELDQENSGVRVVELALPEPRRIRVRDDDRVAEHVALEPCLESSSSFVHHEPPRR